MKNYHDRFFKKIFGKRFDELRAYNWDFRYEKNSSQNLVIYSQGRSGSTLLASLLQSTGYFDSYYEILDHEKKLVSFPFRYLNGYSKSTKNNFLFNLKIQHLNYALRKKEDPNSFMRRLSRNGWKIIWLERSSKLDQTLSNFLAEDSSRYHNTNGIKKPIRIKIDCDSFNNRIERIKRLKEQESKSLQGVSYIYLNYEKDLLNEERHQATVDKILKHLNLPSKEVSTSYSKINIFKNEDIITNYSEFEEKVLKPLNS